MIEMLLPAFCFVLAAAGWPGFNQREKMLATNVAIVWLQEESREDGEAAGDSDGGTGHPLSRRPRCGRAPPFPASLRRDAGQPGAPYLGNIMLINVLICWTFPLPVL